MVFAQFSEENENILPQIDFQETQNIECITSVPLSVIPSFQPHSELIIFIASIKNTIIFFGCFSTILQKHCFQFLWPLLRLNSGSISQYQKYHNTLCFLFSLGTYNGPKINWDTG